MYDFEVCVCEFVIDFVLYCGEGVWVVEVVLIVVIWWFVWCVVFCFELSVCYGC